ncbi:DUF6880 family protein [Novosphingobium sp.]|uniref:DUF6880 family protein n=1 Tax=Novosphingobium sp. TaxID=1874826 RepID=UPI003342992A
MASEKTLNAKNLAALGAERLADLLLELATGDAAAKRRLRLELASRSGGSDVAAEIRKRLATIAKSRSFVDWRKIKPLAQDIEMQRAAIMDHVAPTNPVEAFDLLWRILTMAPSIYARCDDSNGVIGSVISLALADLGVVSVQARLAPATLADRVFQGVCANDHGQFDGLIALMAMPLGRDGLEILQARFSELAARPPARPRPDERRLIGLGNSGPLSDDDGDAGNHARTIQSALTEIADALGDVDAYAACFSAEERTNPAIAARIAQRLLGADRAVEAMSALGTAEPRFRKGGHWPDWQSVRIDTLDALGRSDDAQTERWAGFEQSLNADYLRAVIKRLPDFDDEEAEMRALAYVSAHPDFNQALAFLINWPAHDLAAKLVLARQGELDGNRYDVLTPAADALEQRHPFAATLMLRAMIDFSLIHARHKRYGHAARHLQTCEQLSKRIDDFGDRRDHAAYVAHLRRLHGRRSGFWNA